MHVLETSKRKLSAMHVFANDETTTRDANPITVDRDNVLATTFSELEFIENFRLTFTVDFMGEHASDLGGPRREWIRIMNKAIKQKYFDKGLRQYLSEDYYYVGIMIAIAMLQNGQLPVYMTPEVIDSVLSTVQSSNPCIREIQAGLEELGMIELTYCIHISFSTKILSFLIFKNLNSHKLLCTISNHRHAIFF